MSKKKGWTKKDHKYIARVKLENGRYRYFYSQLEIKAWQAGSRLSKLAEKVKTTVKDIVEKAGEKLKDAAAYLAAKKKQVKEKWNQLKTRIRNRLETRRGKTPKTEYPANEHERHYKYLAKIPQPGGGFRYFYDQAELDAYYKKNKNAIPPGFDKFELKDDLLTKDADMSEINEDYDPYDDDPGYENNCYSSTLAYEARRRGFDVEAINDPDGNSFDAINEFYGTTMADWLSTQAPVNESNYREASSAIENALSQAGPDARGQFLVSWTGGGGHSVVWENDDKGHTTLRDCQSGEIYEIADLMKNASGAMMLRTDDKELTQAAANCLRPAS